MSMMIHANELVIFENEDGSYSGKLMIDGVEHRVYGEARISAGGRRYIAMKVAGREQIPPQVGPSQMLPARSPRADRLAIAMREVEAKYRRGECK